MHNTNSSKKQRLAQIEQQIQKLNQEKRELSIPDELEPIPFNKIDWEEFYLNANDLMNSYPKKFDDERQDSKRYAFEMLMEAIYGIDVWEKI